MHSEIQTKVTFTAISKQPFTRLGLFIRLLIIRLSMKYGKYYNPWEILEEEIYRSPNANRVIRTLFGTNTHHSWRDVKCFLPSRIVEIVRDDGVTHQYIESYVRGRLHYNKNPLFASWIETEYHPCGKIVQIRELFHNQGTIMNPLEVACLKFESQSREG